MSSIAEKFAAATKAHIEVQLGLFNAVAGTTFEAVAQVIHLNVDTTRATMADASDALNQMMRSRDSKSLIAATVLLQPNAEKALDYGRRLAEIAASMQAELAQVAETQVGEATRATAELIDEASRTAPAKSQNAIAIMKSMLGVAYSINEQLAKNARQLLDTLHANMSAATERTMHVAEKQVRLTHTIH